MATNSAKANAEIRNAPSSLGEESAGHSPLFAASLSETEELQKRTLNSSGQGRACEKIDGVVIGRLVGFDAERRVLVQSPSLPTEEPIVAAAIVGLGQQHIGREVAIAFVEGNPRQPIILGLLYSPAELPSNADGTQPNIVQVRRDNEQLVLTAEREIVLRCGDSSITLTKAGKVIIRGKYLLSRAEGVNRIKGGAVQIN